MQSAICDLKKSAKPLPAFREKRDVGVAISGAGLITALGDSAEETWSRLMRGECIRDHSLVNKQWGGSRVLGLARDATREAVGQAGWSDDQLRSAGLVVGTSKGTIVDWIESGKTDSAGVAAVAEQLDIVGGPRLTVSAACASGLLALIRGVLMIKAGEAKRVLVVAVEASVHELFLASFQRLGVLARAGEGCRPFNEERSGFLMSEAGAAVCLENAGESDGAGVIIERMAMGADATHLIGGDEQGRTLRTLLEDVLDGRGVDLVHAHGTGTVANDAMELSAIEDRLAAVGGRCGIYSHKGALGHSLGAAGLVSVVINRMMHERGMIPPALGENFMPMQHVSMHHHPQKRNIQRSIAIAAGFGGAVAAVSLLST